MQVAVFSTMPYDRSSLIEANDAAGSHHDLIFLEPRLDIRTAALAEGAGAVSAFVNDDLTAPVLERLAEAGTGLVALRCAGFNHVDLGAAARVGITVARVPGYSPYAVAEHTVGLILALNRKIHRAHNRVREGNFALQGLLGFDLRDKTVGVIGTGTIGTVFARLMLGFGCRVVAQDPYPNDECRQAGVEYHDLATVLSTADIISLHCPLAPETHHIIDDDALALMRPGVMLINTSRGALLDTSAVIEALKRGVIGNLGLDVYEEEGDLFFHDHSEDVLRDDVFARLLTFPNVLITGHQAFFTKEALANIAITTLTNISSFEAGSGPLAAVTEHGQG